MRLIDADLLLEELNDFFMGITGSNNAMVFLVVDETKKSIANMINEQPTAYDVAALESAGKALKSHESDICEPEYLGENTAIECREGRCKCGDIGLHMAAVSEGRNDQDYKNSD